MTEHIKIQQDSAVLEIAFTRPDKKNALSNAMYRAATEALDGAQKDPTIRAVLFAAEGDAFTAGNDMADFASAATGKGDGLAAHGFIEVLGRADEPIVAVVPGLAVGVGTTMLLHCDLVFLAEGATLSTPFVNLALVPEAASSMLLPPLIGHVRAFAMFALGEAISAAEALSLGLANKVLPKDEVLPAARQAGADAGNAAARSDRSHQKVDARQAGKRLQTNEAREALNAFAERRKPDLRNLCHKMAVR